MTCHAVVRACTLTAFLTMFATAPGLAAQTFTDFASFVAPINAVPGKPAWLQFHVGQRVYVGPDPTGVGAPSHICATAADIDRIIAQSELPTACQEEAAGAVAIVESVTRMSVSPAPFNAAPFTIRVHEIHGAWRGFVTWYDISPVAPLGGGYRLVSNPGLVPAYRAPRIASANGADATKIVASASVQILQYGASSGAPQAEILIISGKFANTRGWVDVLSYLKTASGSAVGCFCIP